MGVGDSGQAALDVIGVDAEDAVGVRNLAQLSCGIVGVTRGARSGISDLDQAIVVVVRVGHDSAIRISQGAPVTGGIIGVSHGQANRIGDGCGTIQGVVDILCSSDGIGHRQPIACCIIGIAHCEGGGGCLRQAVHGVVSIAGDLAFGVNELSPVIVGVVLIRSCVAQRILHRGQPVECVVGEVDRVVSSQ